MYSDPDFGTPLFGMDGGASSCQWEVGTAHRSAPTLSWEYMGPDVLQIDEHALFKVTLGQGIEYMGSDPIDKFRPGWMDTDFAYVAAFKCN